MPQTTRVHVGIGMLTQMNIQNKPNVAPNDPNICPKSRSTQTTSENKPSIASHDPNICLKTRVNLCIGMDAQMTPTYAPKTHVHLGIGMSTQITLKIGPV